jgi:hypothetical protein
MHWRELLSRLGVCEPPMPDLVREAADRSGLVNRRAFLGLAGAAVASLTVDPERLLWVPNETTILLPPPPTVADVHLLLHGDHDLRVGDAVSWGLHSYAREIRSPSTRPGEPTYYGIVEAVRSNGVIVRTSNPREQVTGNHHFADRSLVHFGRA